MSYNDIYDDTMAKCRKVGTEFMDRENGVRLKVVKAVDNNLDRSCDGCYYQFPIMCGRYSEVTVPCKKVTRSTGDNVIFKQIV